MKKQTALLSSVATATLLSACATNNVQQKPTQQEMVGMANPASVYCEKVGGKSFVKKDAEGNETGYCKLPNGEIVDEWDFFRNNHQN